MTTFSKPSDAKPVPSPERRGTAEDRATVPRDQWGRYLIPDLDGTKPPTNKGRTRVSTTKSALSNTIGIQKWTNRLTAEGVAANEEIRTAILSAMDLVETDRKKRVAQLAGQALDRAGGKDRSNLGTAVHEATERINRGDTGVLVPEQYRPSVDAYYQLLHENNIRVLPGMMERTVLCPWNNGGTFDNIVEWWNQDTEEWELVVADLKTGRDLELGYLEILIQLWMYANALGLWTTTKTVYSAVDPDLVIDVEGFYEPMPRELRKDKALIFHVPMNGSAELLVLDLGGVEKWAEAAVTAKRANAEAKHKVRSVGKVAAQAFVAEKMSDQQAYDYAAQTISPEFARALAPNHPTPDNVERVAAMAAPLLATDDDDPVILTASATLAVTADQQAQADKAVERQALADKVLALPVFTSPAGSNPAPPVERDPVTGRKKRTCGHCRKPGHTQKNCPENPDSGKYVASPLERVAIRDSPAVIIVHTPAGEPEPENNCNCQNDGDWHPYVGGMCNPAGPFAADSADGDDAPSPPSEQFRGVLVDQSAVPYCLQIGHTTCSWTSQHPAAPGHWVCEISGKPSKQAYELGQTQVTSIPPTYGAPGDTVTVGELTFTKHSDWAGPAPLTMSERIAVAATRQAVLQLREEAMRSHAWSDEFDAQAQAKYSALMT